MEQNKTNLFFAENNAKEISNREVKSSAFTVHFSVPENAAKLYSALSGEPVTPDEITFRTLEGVLFVAKKNDLAFTVGGRILVISEHQSTINRNMPLRSILYYRRTMDKLIDSKQLYRRKEIMIPTPEFYVFYNGDEKCPPEDTMKLSDVYLDKTSTPMLELSVKVININLPEGHALLEQCRPLYEYSWFIQRVKDYISADLSRDDAITLAVKDCLREGIMVDFVQEHGAEVANMLFTQFNMEDALEANYEEGVEDGIVIGKERGIVIGELQTLMQLVIKKLAKDKSPEIIADELETDLNTVKKICDAVQTHGADLETLLKILSE